MESNPQNRFLPYLCVALLLALITLLTFRFAPHNEFVNFDDPVYVTDNSHVKEGLTPAGIGWAFTNASHASFWHPLTWMSHMLDCQIFGLNPGGHHWVNLFLHIVNTLLLFYVFVSMTGALFCSGFVAALFAVHPLHVESVAWVAERKDVLSTLFWMLAMGAYVWYVRRRSLKRYVCVLLLLALGLMAKPMLVTLPFVFLLLDYWPVQRWNAKERSSGTNHWRDLLWEKLPMIALSATAGAIAYCAQRWGGSLPALGDFSLSERIGNALVSYVSYMWKMIWPVKLAAFYPHPSGTLPLLQIALSVFILSGFSFAAIWQRRQRPYLLVGWFWYMGTLLPVSGLVQVGMHGMADRYTYVPLIGLFAIVAWGGAEIFKRARFSQAGIGLVLAGVLTALMIQSHQQVRVWHDGVTLFEHVIANTPESAKSYNILGDAYVGQERFNDGIACYRKALQIQPSPYVQYNLANALAGIGNLQEAVSLYEQALKSMPEKADFHNNFGIVLKRQGKIADAIFHYQEALRIDPAHKKARYNLQLALDRKEGGAAKEEDCYYAGLAFSRQGKFSEAASQFYEALRLNPGSAEAHCNLGVVLVKMGRLKEAQECFFKALQLKPDLRPAQEGLDAIRDAQERQ